MTDVEERITREEVAAIFGETTPIEAAALLLNPGDRSVEQLRAELLRLSASTAPGAGGEQTVVVEAGLLAELLAELLAALETLLDEATGFSVSGVYFDEDCMGHKGPSMARAVLEKAAAILALRGGE